MFRTIIGTLIVLVAIVVFPSWLQGVFFVAAVVFVPHRFFLFIPAVAADVLYAPTASFTFAHLKVTIAVALLIALRYIIIYKTRLGVLYARSI